MNKDVVFFNELLTYYLGVITPIFYLMSAILAFISTMLSIAIKPGLIIKFSTFFRLHNTSIGSKIAALFALWLIVSPDPKLILVLVSVTCMLLFAGTFRIIQLAERQMIGDYLE